MAESEWRKLAKDTNAEFYVAVYDIILASHQKV
jgi:hypothetical protein